MSLCWLYPTVCPASMPTPTSPAPTMKAPYHQPLMRGAREVEISCLGRTAQNRSLTRSRQVSWQLCRKTFCASGNTLSALCDACYEDWCRANCAENGMGHWSDGMVVGDAHATMGPITLKCVSATLQGGILCSTIDNCIICAEEHKCLICNAPFKRDTEGDCSESPAPVSC